jgi:hypothetical protein
MTNFDMDREIERLIGRLVPLQRFVHYFGTQFNPPDLFTSEDERGFRFTNPDYRHFCLLRSCRVVSALNASIDLAQGGYVQEIGVLLRTVIEYSRQIEYILINRDDEGNLTGKAAAFVTSFFADNRRGSQQENPKVVKLRQKDVHDAIGATLDEFNSAPESRTTSDLMSNVYLVFSNYVHGRYPETMDLFGGRPGRFHLNGMRGTPKDAENVETLDTLITSASNCFIQVALALKLRSVVNADQVMIEWFREGVSGV